MFKEILDVKKRISEAFTPKTLEKRAASKRGLASVKKEKEILPMRKSARLEGGQVVLLFFCTYYYCCIIAFALYLWICSDFKRTPCMDLC